MRSILRRGLTASAALAAVIGAAGSTGCSTTSDQLVARDLLEIKNLLEDQKKEMESTQRKLEFRLDTLEEKVETRTEMLKTNLTGQEESLRKQGETVEQLRKQVDTLSFSLSSASNPAGPSSASPAETPAQQPAPAANPGEAEYDAGQKQYALGNYAEARTQFEKAVAAEPAGDLKLKAQFWLAESLYQIDDFGQAAATYTQVIRTDNSHPLAWQSLERLAQVNARQGKTEAAVKLYTQIVEHNPTYEGVERVKEQLRILGGGAAN